MTCSVYFQSDDGRVWGHTTEGDSLFTVCRRALTWFADPFWKGPQPHDETVLKVTLVGGELVHYVRVRSVRQHYREQQAPLFPHAPEPFN